LLNEAKTLLAQKTVGGQRPEFPFMMQAVMDKPADNREKLGGAVVPHRRIGRPQALALLAFIKKLAQFRALGLNSYAPAVFFQRPARHD